MEFLCFSALLEQICRCSRKHSNMGLVSLFLLCDLKHALNMLIVIIIVINGCYSFLLQMCFNFKLIILMTGCVLF